MKNKIFVVIFMAASVCLMSHTAIAQEAQEAEQTEQDPMDDGGMTATEDTAYDYTYGEVVSVSDKSVTIKETYYDEDTGDEKSKEMTYMITSDTEVDDANNKGGVQVGQDVEIEFDDKGDHKDATYIYIS